MSTALGTEAVADLLGSVAQLLDGAATATWRIADGNFAAGSALHDLGLGMFLARSTAAAMLPEGYTATNSAPAVSGEQDPRALVNSAEQLARRLPIADVAFPEIPTLVVQVCDLVREAKVLLHDPEDHDV